jgi:drug/metabolite transporter (DMT)-like permease
MNRGTTIAIALLCVALTAAAQISLKLGVSSAPLRALLASSNASTFISRALFATPVLVGLALYGVSTVLWLLVLARSDVSFAYPFVSLGFVLTASYGSIALHESMGPARLTGIALIAVGVVFVARS